MIRPVHRPAADTAAGSAPAPRAAIGRGAFATNGYPHMKAQPRSLARPQRRQRLRRRIVDDLDSRRRARLRPIRAACATLRRSLRRPSTCARWRSSRVSMRTRVAQPLADAHALRLVEHRCTERDVADATARGARAGSSRRRARGPASGRRRSGPARRAGCSPSACPLSTCARSAPNGRPLRHWPQSSTTILSMMSVSESSTALIVP